MSNSGNMSGRSRGVLIRGEGVAAQCSAGLLRSAGYEVIRQATSRRPVPAVMLSQSAVNLMRDITGVASLYHGAHRISRRVVQWGGRTEPAVLPHDAIVVSEAELLDAFPDSHFASEEQETRCTWVLMAAKPLIAPAKEQHFGNRMATAHRVWLKSESDSNTCWVESRDEGWLFLIPNSPKSAWLLSVGDDTAGLIRESNLIRAQILAFGSEVGQFPVHPRIASALSGSGWLACGSAAMSFDPLCGDGTAHSVREAILAAAAIRAIGAGENAEAIQAHYDARLTAGFARHLQLCRDFYRSGMEGPWWRQQLVAIDSGLAWCDAKLKTFAKFEYRLDGLDLMRVA